MKPPPFPPIVKRSLLLLLAASTAAFAADPKWQSLFDGRTLQGWHVSAQSGHSAASKRTSGGKWFVKDGAIWGMQDPPGNGGLLLTDEKFGDCEVSCEVNIDFGVDSGLFLRSTEGGTAWQGHLDYHAGGTIMGIRGEGKGLDGVPRERIFSFAATPDQIQEGTKLPVAAESWSKLWRVGGWNAVRMQIAGNPPVIKTSINGTPWFEWKESILRHPATGAIGLQIHGGERGGMGKLFVRFRNLRVREVPAAK